MVRRVCFMLMVSVAFFALGATQATAGEIDVLIDKLVEKGVLTPLEGQIIADEAKTEMAKDLAEGKASTAPSWTQKIKMKGDVRFRTQADWGKNLVGRGNTGRARQRIRERVRARIGVEGNVNDQIAGGVRFATGDNNDSRSTNDTLTNSWVKGAAWFDKYYIRWQPKWEFIPVADIKDYLLRSDMNVWGGKFGNPFMKSELVWDSDINPDGVALQYVSPSYTFDFLPEIHWFSNWGILWLEEQRRTETDPLMFVWQFGTGMLLNEDWGSNLKFAFSFYNPTNTQGKLLTNTAGTNALYPATYGDPIYQNQLRYEHNFIDLLIQLDQKSLFGIDIGNGAWADFVVNTSPTDGNGLAWATGAYIGKKKVSKPGEWKLRGDIRYIERDALLDNMPDSDFIGFTNQGTPSGGGTNTYGFNWAFEYGLLKIQFLTWSITGAIRLRKSWRQTT